MKGHRKYDDESQRYLYAYDAYAMNAASPGHTVLIFSSTQEYIFTRSDSSRCRYLGRFEWSRCCQRLDGKACANIPSLIPFNVQ
jgi:hypothetical protein